MTFLHVGNVPRNICRTWVVCQTTRLHPKTPFKTYGRLPIYSIDFLNRLHLNLTSFCPLIGWSNRNDQIHSLWCHFRIGKGEANIKDLSKPLGSATTPTSIKHSHSQVCNPVTAAMFFQATMPLQQLFPLPGLLSPVSLLSKP